MLEERGTVVVHSDEAQDSFEQDISDIIDTSECPPLFQNPLGIDHEILRAKSPVEKKIVNITGSLDDLEVAELKQSSMKDQYGN